MSVMAPKKQRVLENLNPVAATPVPLVTETAMDTKEDVAADDEEVSDRDYLLSRQRAMDTAAVETTEVAGSGAWVQDELDPGEVCGLILRANGPRLTFDCVSFLDQQPRNLQSTTTTLLYRPRRTSR